MFWTQNCIFGIFYLNILGNNNSEILMLRIFIIETIGLFCSNYFWQHLLEKNNIGFMYGEYFWENSHGFLYLLKTCELTVFTSQKLTQTPLENFMDI